MSETDAGCHMRPPTAHNEGHPPFCSGSPTVSTIPSHWASFPPPRAPATFLSRSSLGQRSAERVEKREKMMIKKKRSKWRERRRRTDPRDSLETSVGPRLSLLLPPIQSAGTGLCTLTVPGHVRRSTGLLEGGGGGHCRPLHLFSSQAICSVSFGPACWTVEGHETWPSLLPSSMAGEAEGVRARVRARTHAHTHIRTHAWRLFTLLLLRRLQT